MDPVFYYLEEAATVCHTSGTPRLVGEPGNREGEVGYKTEGSEHARLVSSEPWELREGILRLVGGGRTREGFLEEVMGKL